MGFSYLRFIRRTLREFVRSFVYYAREGGTFDYPIVAGLAFENGRGAAGVNIENRFSSSAHREKTESYYWG